MSKVTNQDWEKTYTEITLQGFMMKDMPSANSVWGSYLFDQGFRQHVIENTCPDCYTVRDFCDDYPNGTYLLAIGSHVVAVENGNYFDTWDSGDEIPIYYWQKEVNDNASIQ